VGDYTPVYAPSKVVSMTVSSAVVGGDILIVSGNGTVAKCTTLQAQNYVGVAGEDTAANGRVTVYSRGFIHESLADGAVNAGSQLNTSGTAGRQVVAAPATSATPAKADVDNARAIIGVALTTVADGQKVRWMEF
jgi:hypothetical protein